MIISIIVHMISVIVHSMDAQLNADSIGHACHTVATHSAIHPHRIARTVCTFWRISGHVYPAKGK